MDLIVKATTNVPDLIIDFIEVKLKSGKTVSLNWDRSNVTHFETDNSTSFFAEYYYLYFGEERAQGGLSEFENLRVEAVGLYSETHPFADISIEEMKFTDGEDALTFENVFSAEGVSADG